MTWKTMTEGKQKGNRRTKIHIRNRLRELKKDTKDKSNQSVNYVVVDCGAAFLISTPNKVFGVSFFSLCTRVVSCKR